MIGYIVAVWAVAIIGGYLPYVVGASLGDGSDIGSHSPWLSVLNVMSGGVFVAAGFMHLLPEAEEDLRELSEECNFEFAAFFTSLGFILVFLLEEAVEQVSTSLDIHHSHSSSNADGFSDERKALILTRSRSPSPNRSRGDNDRLHHRAADLFSISGTVGARKEGGSKGGGDRGQGTVSIDRVNSNTSTGSRVGGTSYGIGYGIGGVGFGGIGSSVSSFGRSVDENYHLYGSSPDSGYPSPIFIRNQYRSPGEGAANASGVAEMGAAASSGGDGSGVVFPGDLGGGSGNGEGTGKAGEGFDDLWPSVGDSGGHVTTLRGDGPARTGVKRLGSKHGSYGSLGRTPAVVSGKGVWSGSGGVNSKGEGMRYSKRFIVAANEIPTSPARDGHGPWIGRRVVASDPVEPFDQEGFGFSSSNSNLSAAEARILARNFDAKRGVSRLDKQSPFRGGTYSTSVGVVVGVALSFHAIMEGLGLGASSGANAAGIFAAIVFHKGLVAFSLGCVLLSSNASRLQYFLFMGVFSLLTPLGALVGILVSDYTSGSTGAGICTALGAGTFIHVAAMEILPRYLVHDKRMKKTKMAFLVLGYLVFSALSLYV